MTLARWCTKKGRIASEETEMDWARELNKARCTVMWVSPQAVNSKDKVAGSCSRRKKMCLHLCMSSSTIQTMFQDPLFLVKVESYKSIIAFTFIVHCLRKMPGLASNWKTPEKTWQCSVFKEHHIIALVHCYLLHYEHRVLPTCTFPIVIWKHE